MLTPRILMTAVIVSLGLQGCVPYYKTRWKDVENPEFLKDWDTCTEQIRDNEGEFDTVEECMFDKGWSKEKDWDIWIMETV